MLYFRKILFNVRAESCNMKLYREFARLMVHCLLRLFEPYNSDVREEHLGSLLLYSVYI